MYFFLRTDLSHYSEHKNIKVKQLSKMNSLRDILYFMLKCAKVKCKISRKLLIFLNFNFTFLCREKKRITREKSYYVKKHTIQHLGEN